MRISPFLQNNLNQFQQARSISFTARDEALERARAMRGLHPSSTWDDVAKYDKKYKG